MPLSVKDQLEATRVGVNRQVAFVPVRCKILGIGTREDPTSLETAEFGSTQKKWTRLRRQVVK